MQFTLSGIDTVATVSPTRAAEICATEWLKHALLRAGSWVRITAGSPTVPVSATHPSRLLAVNPPGWPAGRVFAGRRANWVYPAAAAAAGMADPTPVVRVNGVVQAANAYRVLYPRGWIVFNSAPAAGAVVTAEHAYRYHQADDSNSPFARRVDTLSLTHDDARNTAPDAGELAVDPLDRLQMPAVVAGPAGGFRGRPYELGSNRFEGEIDLTFTCLGEVRNDAIWLADALCLQLGTVIPAFDVEDPAALPPLTEDGDQRAGAKGYPQLCGDYPSRPMEVTRVGGGPVFRHGGLFWTTVGWGVRVGVLG